MVPPTPPTGQPCPASTEVTERVPTSRFQRLRHRMARVRAALKQRINAARALLLPKDGKLRRGWARLWVRASSLCRWQTAALESRSPRFAGMRRRCGRFLKQMSPPRVFSSRRRLACCVGAGLLILRAALWLWGPGASHAETDKRPVPKPVPVHRGGQEDLEHARTLVIKQLGIALRQATEREGGALSRYNTALKRIDRQQFNHAARRIDTILDDTLTLKSCGTLTWLGIKDRFSDTSKAEEYWQSRTIDRLRPPCIAACAALEHAALTLQDDLAQTTTNYHVALARTLDQAQQVCPDLATPIDGLVADVATTFPQFREIATVTATVPLSLALDVAFELSPSVLGGKSAKSLATSWIPLADGPFPLFDVAWGALALTLAARDIAAWNQARGPKRDELRDALSNAVATFRSRALTEVEGRRATLLKVHSATRIKQAVKILNGLGVPKQDWPPACLPPQGAE